MRTLRSILILSGIFILAITSPAYARGGGHGGGGHGGGHGGGRGSFHGGGRIGGYHGGFGDYGGRFFRGYRGVTPFRRGWLWAWGVGLGWPYYGSYYSPYWGWPYYYPYLGWPYYDYNYYDYPYYQQPQEQPYYWYFCQDPQGYYPYIKSCPGGWMKVVPNVTPPQLGGRG